MVMEWQLILFFQFYKLFFGKQKCEFPLIPHKAINKMAPIFKSDPNFVHISID